MTEWNQRVYFLANHGHHQPSCVLFSFLGLTSQVLGFGNDQVFQAVKRDSVDFARLAGLPLLRMVEYGGDGTTFWLRQAVP